MKRAFVSVVLTGVVGMIVVAAAQTTTSSAEAALEAAKKIEIVDGNLSAAITRYQSIVERYKTSDRPLVARALLRMAEAYQKQGDAQARGTYERLVRDYGDQTAAASTAKSRLAALAPSGSSTAPTPQLVERFQDSGDLSLSLDERTMTIANWTTGDIDVREMAAGGLKRLKAIPDPLLVTGPENLNESFQRGVTYWPVPSPDSTQVAYEWEGPFEGKDWVIQLRVMPNQPGGRQRVLVNNPEFARLAPKAWSPEGQSVLTALQKKDKTWSLAWVSVADGAVKVLESLAWRVGGADKVSLSSDGRYIVYAALATNPSGPVNKDVAERRDHREKHIYVLASDGSSRTELTTAAAVDTDPLWSADGRHVLFSSDRSGAIGLWSVPVLGGRATGAPTLVVPQIGPVDPIAITRAGTLYYYRRLPWEASIFVLPAADVSTPRALASQRLAGRAPSWSPDEHAIAFMRTRSDDRTRLNAPFVPQTLVIHSLETGEERSYGHDLVASASPLWFHDGRRLLVPVAASLGDLGVPQPVARHAWYAVDRQTGAWTKVLDADAGRRAIVAIAPDDRTVYYTARHEKATDVDPVAYMATDVITGQRRQVFDGSSLARGFRGAGSVSPDGRSWVIVWGSQGVLHLGVISLEGGSYRDLDTLGQSFVSFLQWSSDSRSILWGEVTSASTGSQSPRRIRIMRIPANGGQAEFAGLELDGEGNSSPRLSPDGSRVADATTTQLPNELWSLDVSAVLKGWR